MRQIKLVEKLIKYIDPLGPKLNEAKLAYFIYRLVKVGLLYYNFESNLYLLISICYV